MTFVVAIHASLIMSISWATTGWFPTIIYAPFGIGDLYGMLWVLSVVGKRVERANVSEG